MKKTALSLTMFAALSACTSVYVPTFKEIGVIPAKTGVINTSVKEYKLSRTHWTDVAKIRDEAFRLSDQVSKGSLTKVQAAQLLNRFRVKLIGHNDVDDSVYDVYLRSAVDSQRGVITTEQSKQYIQNALKGWQQRWHGIQEKPDNPAFTNFLLEVMKMEPLK
ncbi:MAG: prokaryotic membrane lipolipid attachment site family protein [Neisseria sp.]|nr:prokaryotic membrane lipolipid attachment site family protein [Neisseria sp.]